MYYIVKIIHTNCVIKMSKIIVISNYLYVILYKIWVLNYNLFQR